MQSFQIGPNEAGQRFDKFLHKFMPEAQNSFLYKMLRKKNITLNGKKAEGKEILQIGDNISFFFADETFSKFIGKTTLSFESKSKEDSYIAAYQKLKGISVIYEDEDVLILNKPAGILTQKASEGDLSLNEWLIGYMLSSNYITQEELRTFHPSVCNRLDRNTSGLVLCGKSLAGSQELGKLIHDRKLGKFYRTIVKGRMNDNATITGYLEKDEKSNKVKITKEKGSKDADYIETAYVPLDAFKSEIGTEMTYLEVELITGKTHQIRAHLASIGHPLLGDYKYGNKKWNEECKNKWKISHQLLHAYRIEFPTLTGTLEALSGQEYIAPLPTMFSKCIGQK